MATYKVLQDIEAEDKLLGPLTLRQFVYAAIAAVSLYLTYFLSTHHAAFMSAVLLPIAVIAGFFAFPWGRDQPTELWALAKIRFMLKPHRRIWDQSGIKELVSVTAPKKVEVDYTNGLSQTEVKSRLSALADTLDSRGWAVKNAFVNLATQPAAPTTLAGSDRLVSPGLTTSIAADITDVGAADDILDEQNNPNARRVDSLVEASAVAHRQQIINSLNAPAQPTPPPAPTNNYWFMNQPAAPARIPSDQVTFNTQVVTPGMEESDLTVAAPGTPTQAEKVLLEQLADKKEDVPMAAYYAHLRKIQPLSAQQPAPAPKPQLSAPTAPPPPPTPPATLVDLSHNNDLNVATIAREATKRAEPDQGEVVVSLH